MTAYTLATIIFTFMLGFLMGIFVKGFRDFCDTVDAGTMKIDEENVEDGLFTIHFTDDPTKAKKGKWIRFKVV